MILSVGPDGMSYQDAAEILGIRSAQSARAYPAAATLLRQILDMEERRSSAALPQAAWCSSSRRFIHHPSARARITARKEVGMRPVLLWFLGTPKPSNRTIQKRMARPGVSKAIRSTHSITGTDGDPRIPPIETSSTRYLVRVQ